jgi:hypothetical protein
MSTAITIDHNMYPHIVELIADYAPLELRATSRDMRSRVDATFPHWRDFNGGKMTPQLGCVPRRASPIRPRPESCPARYLDVTPNYEDEWSRPRQYMLPNLEVVRYLPGIYHSLWFPAPTAIIFAPVDDDDVSHWDDRSRVVELPLNASVKHLVINLWPPKANDDSDDDSDGESDGESDDESDGESDDEDNDANYADPDDWVFGIRKRRVRRYLCNRWMEKFLRSQPDVRSVTVLLLSGADLSLDTRHIFYPSQLFTPLAHLIALHDANITVVCGLTSKPSHPFLADTPCCREHDTAHLREDAILEARWWRRIVAYKLSGQDGEPKWPGDDHAWPQNDEEAATVPILAPLDTFDPKAENVRCITLNEWRDEVGETMFRLATDADYVVV